MGNKDNRKALHCLFTFFIYLEIVECVTDQ